MSKFSLKDILAETLKRTDLSKDERDDLIRAQEKLQNMKINISGRRRGRGALQRTAAGG